MIGKSRKYAYLLLLALAISSWWLLKLAGIDEDRMPAPRYSPDFFSKAFVKWEMDAQGALKTRLIADKISHYAPDGGTRLLKPKMVFVNGSMASWTVSSEQGVLSDDGKELELGGKVVIERGESSKSKALTITTSNLLVTPETSYAQTKERAEILSPPNVTTGTGMKLFFAGPVKLQLLAAVKGRYGKK